METIMCCLCCILCFVCGVWAAKGGMLPSAQAHRKQEIHGVETEDALSRDIAAMLAYTILGKEVNKHETNDTDL